MALTYKAYHETAHGSFPYSYRSSRKAGALSFPRRSTADTAMRLISLRMTVGCGGVALESAGAGGVTVSLSGMRWERVFRSKIR